MDRHSFLWPVSVGRLQSVLNAIPGCSYWDPSANGSPSFQPMLVYETSSLRFLCYIKKRISSVSIAHLGTSAGTGGKWDVYQVMPKRLESGSQILRPKNLGTKVMNKLGRFILNHSDLNQDGNGNAYTGIPMSFAEAIERYPAVASFIGNPPILDPVVAGLDPEAGASVDYRPTNQQMQDDDDAPENVWPSVGNGE